MKKILLVLLCALSSISFAETARFPNKTSFDNMSRNASRESAKETKTISFSQQGNAKSASDFFLKPLVHFVTAGVTINEGETTMPSPSPFECIRYQDHVVTIRIDEAPVQPVTVTFAPREFGFGSILAEQGTTKDYLLLQNQVVLQEGELTKDIIVRIFDDGSPEVEEYIFLNFTLSDENAYAEYTSNVYTIKIQDDDAENGYAIDMLLQEDFNAGTLPAGWFMDTIPQDEYTLWDVIDFDYGEWDGEGLFIHHRGNRYYRILVNQSVETKSFDASNYSELNLTFTQTLYLEQVDNRAYAFIEAWNGSEWKILLGQTMSTYGYYRPEQVHVQLPIEFANSDMKIRFRYFSDEAGHWGLDDIKITGTKYTIPISNAVSMAPDQQYIGPNGTAYFYDPENKAILAKIKNLTDHDYGCTSVEIDRAGEGISEWLNGFNITNKTLRAIPSNPDPAGKYEITLYYTAAELGEFVSDVTSMGKSEGAIGVDNAASSSAVPVKVTKYNDDYAFTATFDTGFSGFGLSDAPPSGSLPVHLLSFEGKHTAEGNVLQWATSEETNNDYFTVERSYDAKSFKEIGRVLAIQVLSNLNIYHFTDNHVGYATIYYRLKQVDKNGEYALSSIINIKNTSASEIIVYPNPTRDVAKFRIAEGGNGVATVQVLSIEGRVVTKNNSLNFVDGVVEYNLNDLATGVYQVLIKTGNNYFQCRMAKE